MDLTDRKLQEEFFQDYLRSVMPGGGDIRIASSSYDDEWSAMRYTTPSGPVIVRINEMAEAGGDVPHKTAFVARLLAGCTGDAESFIRKTPGLLDGAVASFDAPVICPDGAAVCAWDSTRKHWPRPFYIRRWVEGPNLAVVPSANYFRRAGIVLRRVHNIHFTKFYPGFKAVTQNKPGKKADAFVIENALHAVASMLPLALSRAIRALPHDAEALRPVLLCNSFFGNNILVDNDGRIRVLDWESAGIGDPVLDFFPLKYWTAVDSHSGWYVPDAALFDAFRDGYGAGDFDALCSRPERRYFEAQWLLQRLAATVMLWDHGGLREPFPEPGFYVDRLLELMGVQQ